MALIEDCIGVGVGCVTGEDEVEETINLSVIRVTVGELYELLETDCSRRQRLVGEGRWRHGC